MQCLLRLSLGNYSMGLMASDARDWRQMAEAIDCVPSGPLGTLRALEGGRGLRRGLFAKIDECLSPELPSAVR
jgi:hypothetical protein